MEYYSAIKMKGNTDLYNNINDPKILCYMKEALHTHKKKYIL